MTNLGYISKFLWRTSGPRHHLSTGYQGNLGWGYASALGAANALRGKKRVLSINGDGGFLFTGVEMASAKLHEIPLVAVVVNDNAFGNVKSLQERWYGGRNIACQLASPDFVKMAESFGIAATRADTPEELESAVRKAFEASTPYLIEVQLDDTLESPHPDYVLLPQIRS
mmetsp:Transcript_68790/g.157849  ORF Transcript_68790/g.157849 Transcript_68790/m.157849 type:complete len:170 (-) Transcript_68790:83-592(-)